MDENCGSVAIMHINSESRFQICFGLPSDLNLTNKLERLLENLKNSFVFETYAKTVDTECTRVHLPSLI